MAEVVTTNPLVPADALGPQPFAVEPAARTTAVIRIVTPFYNATPLFHETAASVLNQTFAGWEWVIVDDGSSDLASLALLDAYAARDPRVQVIHHARNLGLSAARNTGVADAQTAYFLQLDDDDLIEPTFIEKCLWALESHTEWSFCNAWSIGFGSQSFKWDRGFDLGRDFLAENQVTPTAVIRVAADRAIGGHDESIREGLEDWDYWLKMAAHGYWGGTIPEYLTRYRYHEQPTYWPNRDDPARKAKFRRELRRRYPHLWERNGFPTPVAPAGEAVQDDLPFAGSTPGQAEPDLAAATRILILAPWFSLGGADRFNLSLVEQWQRRGCTVTLCATTDGPHPWLPAFNQLTADIFLLPSFLRLKDYPRFLRYLIQARQVEVVVISNSMLGYSLLPYLRTHCPDTVFVDYNHMATEWLQGGFARVGVNCQRWLDLNLTASEQVKAWMVQRGADPQRVAVCYINIDTAEWDPARYDQAAIRRRWQIPDKVPVILYPARLEPQKRPRTLAEILRGLQRANQRFVCLIAGDGPQRPWLSAALNRYGLRQQARLLGAVDPGQMPELVAAADVMLLPSQDEGISLAVYEAMAMGVTPVVADVGGQRELVTPETGFLVPHGPDEVETYVQIVSRLLASPDLRAQMGQAARGHILTAFTAEQLMDRMQELFTLASRLARSAPRERLDVNAAHALAAQVVEDLRYERLQERLRSDDPLSALGPSRGLPDRWHAFVYQVKRRLFRPFYYWALRHGFDPIVPLANRAYRLLSWLLR